MNLSRYIFDNKLLWTRVLVVISVVMISLLLVFSAYAFQEDQANIKQKTRAKPHYERSESMLGSQKNAQSVRPELDPIYQELREARRAGDMDKVNSIRAQLKKNTVAKGESAGQTHIIQRKGEMIGGPGERYTMNAQLGSLWGTDIHVRSAINTTFRESYPAVTTDSQGNLYAIWEDHDPADDMYLQAYRSTDGGQSWVAWGWLAETGADLMQPSIAVGEGNEDALLIAYIVDNGVDIPYPEVNVSPPGSYISTGTRYTVPIWDWWEGYEKPVIWTDSWDYSYWYGYLTCDGIMNSASDNMNGCFWNSYDFGVTWGHEQCVFGDMDAMCWIDHDGSYGTYGGAVYVANFNASDSSVNCIISWDFGETWDDSIVIDIMWPMVPYFHAVDPDIEAAANGSDNVMICFTRGWDVGDEDIGYCYSQDAGYTWDGMWSLDGYTLINDFAAELNANEGGGSWHLAYTNDHHVFYSNRPQDLSSLWMGTPILVDDAQFVSHDYPKKGITSNWDTDVAGIVWSDYRDGIPDYDIYFDFGVGDGGPRDILFDISHGFDPGHNDVNNVTFFSDLKDLLVADGRVVTDDQPNFDLTGYNAVFLAIPNTGYTAGELADIQNFVDNGGVLVVCGEWEYDFGTPYLNDVTSMFGIYFDDNTVYDDSDNDNGVNYWPMITSFFDAHPIVSGPFPPATAVTSNALYAGASLTVDPGVTIIATGDNDSYTVPLGAELANEQGDRDGAQAAKVDVKQYDPVPGKPVVMAATCYGAGCVFVIGDANIFGNETSGLSIGVNYYDNGQLALNVFNWDCYNPQPYAHFMPVDPTGDSRPVIINDAYIDGWPLVPGDEIGVFDGPLCVGAGIYQGTFPVTVTVWMEVTLPDLTVLPGAIAGNSMIFRMWDSLLLTEIPAIPTYTTGTGIFGQPLTVVDPLNGMSTVTQTIPIVPGRLNLISFNVEPLDYGVDAMLGSLSTLLVAKDDEGQYYIPPYSVNSIGNVDLTNGYYLYITGGSTENVVNIGYPMDPTAYGQTLGNTQIYYIGYPYQVPHPVVDVFASIAGNVVVVQDDEGRYWIPAYSTNTIGNMLPGKGYQIFVDSPSSFTYPVLANRMTKAPEPVPELPEPTHFRFAKTGLSYGIVITDARAALTIGDEVGVFAGDLCVGAAVFNGEYPFVVPSWEGNDEYKLKGFKAGQSISFKVWSAADNQEYDVVGTFTETDGSVFRGGPISVASLGEFGGNGVIPTVYALDQNYPNPFNPDTKITYHLPEAGEVNLAIYSVEGKLIRQLYAGKCEAGSYEVVWNGRDEQGQMVAGGIYFYRLKAADFTAVKKLILVK